MSVELLNRQRRYEFRSTDLIRIAEAVLADRGRKDADLSIVVTNDARLRALNRDYRGKDRPTDVLSFPYDEDDGPIGDVLISIDRAKAQADARGHSLQRELEILTLHGTLHVCGYDHETDDGQMDRIERRLRRRLLSPDCPPGADDLMVT
jgi:probable rRNA maturation factor